MFHGIFFRPVLIRVLMEQITGKKIIMPEVSGRIRKVQNRFETYLKTKMTESPHLKNSRSFSQTNP